MSEDTGKRSVRVEIFGEEYTLRSEAEEEYTRACARYVDEAIREAHLQSRVSEPHRAAILAALEITDELFRLRYHARRSDERVAARAAELRASIEGTLEG
jgi:cell division protein ZapA